ncbi:hypothetical protein C9374_003563 [Naegleria lovaniensis]|uniref:Uncharacterized protein n=1 Tax=Naegleria lovaniensis TaxID=51637 RepID=A0AA88H5C8_NAELO|nr:uncharacterized protein C9374_003563 [Naegleria lovaniensis]KAG2393799.1 hypothetical protein C9374_003563 [Naegleria lovaniensis]
MPSIHPSFFFPLCWLPSPQHDHYFSTSYKCNSNVRIRLHELYTHQLREQREKKRKSLLEQHQPSNAAAVAHLCYNPHAMCVSSQDVTMKHTNMMTDHHSHHLHHSQQSNAHPKRNHHPHQHFHEKKQPSFGDEDTMEMISKNLQMLQDQDGDLEMHDCSTMTKIHESTMMQQQQQQQQQLSLSILAPSSTSTFSQSENGAAHSKTGQRK